MKQRDLEARTRRFALEMIEFCAAWPRTETARVLGRQSLRAGTSVGANYRAACHAKSTADFISQMGTVEREADESDYWLDLLQHRKLGNPDHARALLAEADEHLATVVASINTARRSGGRLLN